MKKFLIAAAVILAAVAPARADAPADLSNALEGLKIQMANLQKTVELQNARIETLESRLALEPTEQGPVIPAPSAVETDVDFQNRLKNNLGTAFPWLKGARYGGDLRLRYEAFDYFDKNDEAGSTGTAADRTRNRFRVRLRWGLEKDFLDDWKIGFRLATGTTTDQTSTNVTLGNPGYFNFKTINVERAYALYSPSSLKGKGNLKDVTIGAGKFENPFLRYSTPYLWDADITPEGAYEKFNVGLYDSGTNKVSLVGVIGQFLVNENAALESDANIWGYQGVITVSTAAFNTEKPVEAAAALSFYDYTNWFQTVAANSAATSYLRTNTIVADDFRVLDFYPEIIIPVGGMPVAVFSGYSTNLANVGTDDAARSGGNDIHDADDAWGAGLRIGKAQKKGDAEFSYAYYEIGANAVVAAFSESDFGGPGGTGFTNREGHKFGVVYQLTDSITANWTGCLVFPLNPTADVANSQNEKVFRSQVDLNFKY